MKFKLLHKDQQSTFAVIMERGDNVTDCIAAFAKQQKLSAAQFTAIGAFSRVTLGFFDPAIKDYKRIQVDRQTEVLSMIGDVSLYENEPKIHAHVVLGNEDGSALGGHLLEATANPTVEIILTESPAYLERKLDKVTGLPLIKI